MADERSVKRAGWLVARIVVSAALLGWVLPRSDLRAMVGQLRQLDPPWLLAFAVVFVLSVALRALKWQLMLRARGIALPYRTCVALYWNGLFWNQLLPTRVGGDAVKIGLVAARVAAGHRLDAAMSVVADRVTNILGLFLLLLAGTSRALSLDNQLATSLLAAALVALLVVVLVRSGLPGKLSGAPWLRRLPGMPAVASGVDSLGGYFARGRPLAVFIILGVAVQCMMILNTYVVARGLGIPLPLADYLVIMPVVAIVTLIPVTVNGIGLRENAFVYVTGFFALAREPALALSLAVFALTLLASTPGGFLRLSSAERRDDITPVASIAGRSPDDA